VEDGLAKSIKFKLTFHPEILQVIENMQIVENISKNSTVMTYYGHNNHNGKISTYRSMRNAPNHLRKLARPAFLIELRRDA